jgi:hypothetical protein
MRTWELGSGYTRIGLLQRPAGHTAMYEVSMEAEMPHEL